MENRDESWQVKAEGLVENLLSAALVQAKAEVAVALAESKIIGFLSPGLWFLCDKYIYVECDEDRGSIVHVLMLRRPPSSPIVASMPGVCARCNGALVVSQHGAAAVKSCPRCDPDIADETGNLPQ